MTDQPPPANAFEPDKPGTNARSDAEGAIEALRQRGGIFVEAVRATRMAMALTDPTLPGNPIVFANQSFLSLSGYSMEEVLGQQPHFMNGQDTDPADAERFRQILEEDRDGVIETVQYAKDGRRFVATVLLTAFKDDAGKTLHHFLSWADVTRRVAAEDEAAALLKAQAALQESEAKYRTLFDSIDEGFCVIEVLFDANKRPVDYIFLETNAAFERQTGLTKVTGRRMREIAPDHEQHWFDIYGRIAMTGEPQRFERPAQALGRWYEVYAFRMGDPEQRHVAILFNDIAERKRAEETLRESEERLGLAVAVGQFASWDWDLRTGKVAWNDRHFLVQGYAVDEVTPSFEAWLARVHPDDRHRAVASIKAARDTKAPYAHEFRTLHPDGTVRWCAARGRFFYDAAGEPYRMIGIMEDATDQKLAEDSLRESEKRFRLIVQNAQDYAIFTTDPQGRIDQWYEGAAQVFGWTADEAIGQMTEITFTSEDRANGEPQKERKGAAKEGSVPNVRWHVRKDGKRIFIEGIAGALRDGGGKLTGFLKIGQDVTERRRAEEHQKTLLAELQHRVRNIMAMIRSVARRTGETAETVEDYVQHLEGRISAIARTQALLTRDVQAAVDLESLIRDELQMQAAQPGQYAVTGPDISLPPKAAEVLGLAIHELATNAMKYGALMEKGGRVDVRWALLHGEKGPQLSLIWSESGVRIDAEPSRRGFGTELVTQRVPYELQGLGTMEFTPTGLIATLEFPLSDRPSILQTDEGRQGRL